MYTLILSGLALEFALELSHFSINSCGDSYVIGAFKSPIPTAYQERIDEV